MNHLFPPIIDSSMLSTLRSCRQKFFREYVQHWKHREPSVHLVAGGAFAAGIEAARLAFYIDGRPSDESVASGLEALLLSYGDFECPAHIPKSLDRMCGALEFYFSSYPLGADGAVPIIFGGQHGIEFSFAEPLPIMHPVSGDPILYCGRSDMIAEAYGGEYIYDEKTTSQLGASWSRQWDLRSQFTGYTWARRQHGGTPTGIIVRGVSILKTKYETLQAITYRSKWECDRWLAQTVRDIRAAIECWRQDYWDWNLDHACAEYGGCSFQCICKSDDPDAFLPVQFTRRVWNPIARQEQTVEEWEQSWTSNVK